MKIQELSVNQSLVNLEANLFFLSVVQNESHTIKTNYNNGEWQDMLLADSGMYEFTEEWDDSVVCYIRRMI